MLLRVLYLIALVGVIGRDAGSAGVNDDEQRMGGEGFGNVLMLVVAVGVLLLGAVVVLAILALTGQFENTAIDPPV